MVLPHRPYMDGYPFRRNVAVSITPTSSPFSLGDLGWRKNAGRSSRIATRTLWDTHRHRCDIPVERRPASSSS